MTRLIGAASAPALPEELRGEHAARTAFTDAHRKYLSAAHLEGEHPVLTSALASKALVVKIAACLVIAAGGGVAIAAETGSLPSSVQNTAHSTFQSLGVPAPKVSAGAKAGVHTTVSAHVKITDVDALAIAAAACHDAGITENGTLDQLLSAPQLQTAAFKQAAAQALARVATTESQVRAYCAVALAKAADEKSTVDSEIAQLKSELASATSTLPQLPTLPSLPVNLPGGVPSSLPSSLPSLPVTLPSGIPSTLPSLPVTLPSNLPSLPGLPIGH